MTLLVSKAPRCHHEVGLQRYPNLSLPCRGKGTREVKKKWMGTNRVPLPQGQLQSSHALQTFMEVTFISMEGTWCLDWSHAPFLLPTALS